MIIYRLGFFVMRNGVWGQWCLEGLLYTTFARLHRWSNWCKGVSDNGLETWGWDFSYTPATNKLGYIG